MLKLYINIIYKVVLRDAGLLKPASLLVVNEQLLADPLCEPEHRIAAPCAKTGDHGDLAGLLRYEYPEDFPYLRDTSSSDHVSIDELIIASKAGRQLRLDRDESLTGQSLLIIPGRQIGQEHSGSLARFQQVSQVSLSANLRMGEGTSGLILRSERPVHLVCEANILSSQPHNVQGGLESQLCRTCRRN